MKKLMILAILLNSWSAYGIGTAPNESEQTYVIHKILPTAKQAHKKARQQEIQNLSLERNQFTSDIKDRILEAIDAGSLNALILVPKRMRKTFNQFSKKLHGLGYAVEKHDPKPDEYYSGAPYAGPDDCVYKVSW